MLHVGLGLVAQAAGDQLLHPARVEIDEVAGAAAHIGEVLDRKSETARAGRADHQPIAVARKILVGERFAEFRVVRLVVFPADALLGHAGGAPRFKNIERLALVLLGDPDLVREITQPLVAVEVREAHQIVGRLDFGQRIPVLLGGPIQPEGAARFRRKVPVDDFAQVRVQCVLRRLDGFFGGGIC